MIRQFTKKPKYIYALAGTITITLLLSLLLAWISSGFVSIQGWTSFLAGLILAGIISVAAWAVMKHDSLPKWLGYLLLAAVILRLIMGCVWYITLPTAGYNSPAEQAGYVMADAFDRDRAAWQYSQTQKPLINIFIAARNYKRVDQYGGMLFLSSFIYRYLGGIVHQPLLMILLTSAFSGLAVLFTWAFAQRVWDKGIAKAAAIGMALYPEAVLLGSSQMREAFTITLAISAFYGLVRFLQEKSWINTVWIFGSLLLILPFSPPVAALVIFMLAVAALSMWRDLIKSDIVRQQRFWIITIIMLLLITAGVWATWSRFAPEGISNPLRLVSWWVKRSASWQAHLSERASGWVQKIFENTPDWGHAPLLLVYGVVQPFLPAALVAVSDAPIWRWIAIWRAIGWTFILPFLLYAPLRAALSGIKEKSVALSSKYLSLIVWMGIILASLRGGGDMWDNPRYRAIFSSLQISLVAWAWIENKRTPDNWLRRALISVSLVILWFIPWYLQRYTAFEWPVVDFFKTLGLGIASSILYVIWDLIKRS